MDDTSSNLPADDELDANDDVADAGALDADEFDIAAFDLEGEEFEFDGASADDEVADEALGDVELGENGVPVIAAISDPVATARRRHGAAGAILAAGMFGADIALGRKVKEEAPVVITASSDPTDIDTDGIEIPIDESRSVFAPPQPPSDPFPPRRPRK